MSSVLFQNRIDFKKNEKKKHLNAILGELIYTQYIN